MVEVQLDADFHGHRQRRRRRRLGRRGRRRRTSPPAAAWENRRRADHVYVTGHRNPDLDSIASAIGYAELKGRLDPGGRYVAARLGEVNAQTRWALERSGAPEPELLPHVHLRARDVMRPGCPLADQEASLRDVGLVMAGGDADLVAITDEAGAVVGMITARNLARRYIKESGRALQLRRPPGLGRPHRRRARG